MEPSTASPESRDEGRPREVNCPWCGSARVEKVGEFGPQLMSHQYMCLDCRSPFEVIRHD